MTLEVTAPSGKLLQSFVSESEGRVDFVAAEDGEYNFCFKNAYSETELSFWINTETDIGLADVAKEGTLACSSSGGRGGWEKVRWNSRGKGSWEKLFSLERRERTGRILGQQGKGGCVRLRCTAPEAAAGGCRMR